MIFTFVVTMLATAGWAWWTDRNKRPARSPWLWLGRVLAVITLQPVVGLGVFFVYALTQDSHWHPSSREAFLVIACWVGMVLLPLSTWVLWREKKPGQPVAPPSETAPPRFSRMAVVGAGLVGVALVAVVAALWMMDQSHRLARFTPDQPRPLPYEYIVRIDVLKTWAAAAYIVAALCGVTGTVLSWVAVVRIRLSAGRRSGLGLATVCGLLLPLLLLDLLCVLTSGNHLWAGLAVLLPLGNILFGWLVWRALRLPDKVSGPEKTVASPPPSFGGGIPKLITVVVFLLGLGLVLVALKIREWEKIGQDRWASSASGVTSARTMGPPYVAHYEQGTVELLALAPHPSTNGPFWRPDGAPAGRVFTPSTGKSWAAGKIMREMAFKIQSRTGEAGFPVMKFSPESVVSGMGGGYTGEPALGEERFFVRQLACVPEAKRADVQIGIADGPWETFIELEAGPNKLSGSSEQGRSDGRWEASFEGVTSAAGDVAVSFNYSHRDDWETRMVSVRDDGQTAPLALTTWKVHGDLTQCLVAFSKKDFARLSGFHLERRKYQWMEFKNVSLQFGYRTDVQVRDAASDDAASVAPAIGQTASAPLSVPSPAPTTPAAPSAPAAPAPPAPALAKPAAPVAPHAPNPFAFATAELRSPHGMEFGPVLPIDVRASEAGAHQLVFIGLEKGTVVFPPHWLEANPTPPDLLKPSAELTAWATASQVDLALPLGETNWGYYPLGARLMFGKGVTNGSSFLEKMTLAETQAILQQPKGREDFYITYGGGVSGYPVTACFLFKTRQGTAGLLELRGVTNEANGLEIRFRREQALVPGKNAAAPR